MKKPKLRIYIAGPMTGIPEHNYPAFNKVAKYIRKSGHHVENPAEIGGNDTSKSWEYYLKRDLPRLMGCDMVVVLPGLENSPGASLEVTIARAMGLDVRTPEMQMAAPVKEEEPTDILAEARRLVHGDRGKNYGHPLEDFSRTAGFWGLILNAPVTPEQVGLCMIALKLSRECHKHYRDHLVDMAGYAETVEMVVDKLQEQKSL